MEFVDFLSLDVTQDYSKKQIMNVVFERLNELDTNGFSINPRSIIPIVKKFVALLNFNGLRAYEDRLLSLSTELSNMIDQLNQLRGTEGNEGALDEIRSRCNVLYRDLFNLVNEAYINLGQGVIVEEPNESLSEFKNLYHPNLSNKRRAIELIEKALKLIESDNLLPSRAKNQIINKLRKILANLKSDKTNWGKYFGAIKETIIILAALVTIGGNKYNLDHIIGAKQSLEKASNTIEITCINQNYIDYINLNNQLLYVESGVKSLPEPDKREEDVINPKHNQAPAADAKKPRG